MRNRRNASGRCRPARLQQGSQAEARLGGMVLQPYGVTREGSQQVFRSLIVTTSSIPQQLVRCHTCTFHIQLFPQRAFVQSRGKSCIMHLMSAE